MKHLILESDFNHNWLQYREPYYITGSRTVFFKHLCNLIGNYDNRNSIIIIIGQSVFNIYINLTNRLPSQANCIMFSFREII